MEVDRGWRWTGSLWRGPELPATLRLLYVTKTHVQTPARGVERRVPCESRGERPPGLLPTPGQRPQPEPSLRASADPRVTPGDENVSQPFLFY